MKQVTFARPQAPFGVGEKRLVPDDVAATLEKEGVIEPNPPSWPMRPVPAPVLHKQPRLFAKGEKK